MNIGQIQTPALIVDKKIFDNNFFEMEKLLSGKKIKLRPHYKSHKCSKIAKMQMEHGAIGMTCAKLDEAIDLVDCGIENVLIANQITDKSKISKMAYLAKCCYLTVCVDNEQNILDIENAAKLAESTVHCFVEFEIGMERCGVSDIPLACELAKLIINCPHLEFDGIQAYAGHISHAVCEQERKGETEKNYKKLEELIAYFEAQGIAIKTVSGGSTGTSTIKASSELYTELQAGSYLFMDSTYKELQLPFKNSLFLLTTVVSVGEDIVVVDGGVKSCGVDQGMPSCVGFEYSEIVASEEHFQIKKPSKKFSIGEKILLIPSHCCSTVNLHEKIYLIENEKVADRFLITARGCFR